MAVPKLRFKRDDGADYPEWKERKLLDFAKRITRKNEGNVCKLPLTISAQFGLIDQIEFFNRTVASKDMSTYYLLMNGEFAYNKSIAKGYPVGAIKRLDRYDVGAVSPLYLCFKLNGDLIHSDFAVQYFETDKWHSGVFDIAQEGARNHGLLNVSVSDFFETVHELPSDIEEQQKIADFLGDVDALIKTSEQELLKLKELKKGCLQKMFPRGDADVPEVRFPGFTGAWESRKLGEVVTITSGESPSKFEGGNELFIKVDDLNYNPKYIFNSQNKVAMNKSIKMASKGSVVFPKRGAAIMTNKVRILAEDCYMDPNIMALTPHDIDSEFLYNFISKEGLYKIADTSTIPQINNKHIEPYLVMLPSFDEQRQIAEFFSNLDNLIALQKRECEKYKELKKGLLQQMFV